MPKIAFEPCIPRRGTEVPTGPDWFYEIKHDGYGLMVHREGKRVRLRSRRGYDWGKRAAFLFLSAFSLSSCADMPHWTGGLPPDATMFVMNVVLTEAGNLYTVSLALAAGILCRRWWHVAVASAAIVMMSEAVLFMSRPNHKFNLASFAVAALVPAVLISLILAFKKYRGEN